jgi:type I restriction enzyme M protein
MGTHSDETGRLVTRSEIARLAGVQRPTVTTWAKRHRDFPKPVSSGEEDYFSLASVASWLDARPVPIAGLVAGEEPGVTYGQRIRSNWPSGDEHAQAAPLETQGQDVTRTVEQLLGSHAEAVRKGGGFPADYLMLLICLIFVRNCAKTEWLTICEMARRPEELNPGGLMRLIGDVTDRTLRAHGILPGVHPLLERLKPHSGADLAEVIRLCDELGPDAVDPMLIRFSAETKLVDASYFTPRHVAHLMASIAVSPRTRSGWSAYDPYIRGGELGTALRSLLGASTLTMRGESPDPDALRIAGINLALHGIPAQFGSGYAGGPAGSDTRIGGFDVVITNPPFNSTIMPGGDADHRWIFGPPPPRKANYAWLQIVISSLAANGKACVLMPLQSTVTSDERELLIRSQMVERGTVTAVISLPPRLFSTANVAATLWVLRTPTDNPGNILLVDARRMSLPDAGDAIRQACDQTEAAATGVIKELTGGGLAAWASIATIRQQNYSLNPADYTSTAVELVSGSATDAVRQVRELEGLSARIAKLEARVGKLQLLQRSSGADLPRGWQRVPLKDVCDIQAGPSYSRLRSDNTTETASVPIIASRHLQDGRVVPADAKYVAEALAQRLGKFRLVADDILCVRSGTIVPPAVVEIEQQGWLFDTNLLRLRVDPDAADSRYLLGFLSLPAVLDWIRDRSKGSAIAFITVGSLEQLEVPLPSLAEQHAMASAFLAFDELIAAHEAFSRAASDARTAISAHLIRGGLTVT